MSEHTRLEPNKRLERLRNFNKRLQESKSSMETLQLWNMTLDKAVVEVQARILPRENIRFGNNQRYACDDNADWTREFRRVPMFKTVELKRWCVITPQRSVREVQNFIKCCIDAARGMKMNIAVPVL